MALLRAILCSVWLHEVCMYTGRWEMPTDAAPLLCIFSDVHISISIYLLQPPCSCSMKAPGGLNYLTLPSAWLADPLNMHPLYSIRAAPQLSMEHALSALCQYEPLKTPKDAYSSLQSSLHLLALVAFARTSTGSGADHRHGLFATL